MSEIPPSGTVTFVLTDLEGSTRLWEQDPNAMKIAMGRHDELLENAIGQQRPTGCGVRRLPTGSARTEQRFRYRFGLQFRPRTPS
jgi:hypothetical protein